MYAAPRWQRVAGAAALAAALAAAGAPAAAAPLLPVLERPAAPSALAEHSVLLAITQAGGRLVAVGERGIALYSDDNGKHWQQAKVPVSVSLTAVAFPTPRQGWATGHAGVILHSEDGGESWLVQMDGHRATTLLQSEAEKAAADNDRRIAARAKNARALATPEADKPFLALYFDDERTGYAAGAYGLLFKTVDAGKTWLPWVTHVDNPKGLHFYAMAGDGKQLLLAGEQGLVLRSAADGSDFSVQPTGYGGSFFALANASGQWLLAGLKGTLLRSTDGQNFAPLNDLPPISWSSMSRSGDSLILVNQAGAAYRLDIASGKANLLPAPPGFPLTAASQSADGSLVGIGLRGVKRLPNPAP
jgi:photosystem II stability/assembly factor-like uncharacterized protein